MDPPHPPRPAVTPEFVEREYDNRALVPEHPAAFARWERDSAFVRDTLPCELDLAYGPDPRHRIDWFPAMAARGTLVFFHGGYWRSLDKSMFSWLASSWVAGGVNMALVNYRLCPAVRIDAIVDDALAAVNWLMGADSALGDGRGSDRVVIAGHSAGGYLAAALLAAPPDRRHFDPARVAGAVPISGIFDFEPLRHFSLNADFGLEPADVSRLDLHDKRPTLAVPLVVAAGESESAEFRRQSELLAQTWRDRVQALLLLPGLNHFTVLDALAERGQPLHDHALALFGP